jgi:antitoxin (DNA-binding transcriptional repressor) of toxin-antitoxin stability system
MTETELARNLHDVLERVRQGTEIVVDGDDQPVAVIKPPEPARRTISDLIRLAEEREKKRGYALTLDPDFAADVEQIVRARNHTPL